MPTDQAEAVKAKIRAMLRLANDDAAAEGEVRNALAFAARLMDQHNLSEEDLDESDEAAIDLERAEFAKQHAYTGTRAIANWEKWLASFVEDFVGGVKSYLTSPGAVRGAISVKLDEHGNPKVAGRIVFYGVAEDVSLAVDLFNELRVAVAAMARIRFGGVYRGSGRDYCEGFVDGLSAWLFRSRRDENDRLSEQGGRSLVLVEKRQQLADAKRTAASDWLGSQGIELGKCSSRSNAVGCDGEAYESGVNDGRSYQPVAARKLKIGAAS